MKQKIISSIIGILCLFSLYSYYSYNQYRLSSLKKEVQTYKEKYNSSLAVIEELNSFSNAQRERIEELSSKNKEVSETIRKYNTFIDKLPPSSDPEFINEINEKTNELFMEFTK